MYLTNHNNEIHVTNTIPGMVKYLIGDLENVESIKISKVYDTTQKVSIAIQGDTNEREDKDLDVKYELTINNEDPINIMWYVIERTVE